MSSVHSVRSLGSVDTNTSVSSSSVEVCKPSFDQKKIQELQKSFGVNLKAFPKKRAVEAGSIFTSNMDENMSFIDKIGQFFQNIKLKFWDVSKDISKDCEQLHDECEKLENFLTKAVTDSMQSEEGEGGESPTVAIRALKKEIDDFLSGFSGENEKNNELLRTLQKRVGVLQKFSEHLDDGRDCKLRWSSDDCQGKDWRAEWRANLENARDFLMNLDNTHALVKFFTEEINESEKTLNEFSQHADALNEFCAFYKEASDATKAYYKESEEKYEFQDKKEWQPKQFEALDEAKAFLSSLEDHPLKQAFTEKIKQIEEKIVGDDLIRNFYEKVDAEKSDPYELASKCNPLVRKLQSIEEWLHVVDPDFKDLNPLGDHPKGGRFWRIHGEKTPLTENSKNKEIKALLAECLGGYPGCSIQTYRGIPYIADKEGKPVM